MNIEDEKLKRRGRILKTASEVKVYLCIWVGKKNKFSTFKLNMISFVFKSPDRNAHRKFQLSATSRTEHNEVKAQQ